MSLRDEIFSSRGRKVAGQIGPTPFLAQRQRSRPYLFSNSLPPVIAMAALKAIDLVAGSISHGKSPGHQAAPVVANDNRFFLLELLHNRGHVFPSCIRPTVNSIFKLWLKLLALSIRNTGPLAARTLQATTAIKHPI